MQKAWQGVLDQLGALHTFLIWAKHGTGYLSLSPRLPNLSANGDPEAEDYIRKAYSCPSSCNTVLLFSWCDEQQMMGLATCMYLGPGKGNTGCRVLGRQGDWGCFNLILKASLFLLLRGGQDCGICACVCWNICLVYSVGNGEEMCFQFYLIYSACLRFYLKLSFLRCSDKKQDFEIKVLSYRESQNKNWIIFAKKKPIV